MQYITKDESGEITSMADWAFPGSDLAEKTVIRGWDGGLYVAGDSRIEKPQSAIDAERAAEIKTLLTDIDAKSARPLRAVIAETATDADRAALADLEAEAQALRTELAGLAKLVPAVKAPPAGE